MFLVSDYQASLKVHRTGIIPKTLRLRFFEDRAGPMDLDTFPAFFSYNHTVPTALISGLSELPAEHFNHVTPLEWHRNKAIKNHQTQENGHHPQKAGVNLYRWANEQEIKR